MPTLIQIDSCLGKGSTGRITEAIGGIMKKQGWDCYVVHGARYLGKTQLNSIQVVSENQEYLHALGSMLFDRHGLCSSVQTKKVVQKLRRLKPDIVHLHCVHGYYINYEILFDFLKEINVPVVWTFHDCWAFTGHCAHFAFANCEKWKTGCYTCPLIHDYPKSLFIDNSKSNWNLKKQSFTSIKNMHIVGVSNWLADLAKQSFLRDYPVHVIYNGVDLSIFKPNKNNIRHRYNIANNEIMVLGVATAWSPEKGLEEFKKLSQEKGIKVVLVGISSELKKILPKEIISINRTESQKELAEFYSTADVFVNPTYNDSFPTVNLESLACCTPVITYRTGGSPEAVDEYTGVVVEQGNYEELLNTIQLFKETSFKDKHSGDCRRRAEECFDKDMRFQEYSTLYNKLLNL